MKVVVNSLFRKRLHSIKLAALYCDQIVLPDVGSGLGIILNSKEKVIGPRVPSHSKAVIRMLQGWEPTFFDDIPIPITRTVASWSTIPNGARSDLKLLIDEEILVLSDEDHGIEQETFRNIFDEMYGNLFNSELKSLEVPSEHDELKFVVDKRSPCVNFTMRGLNRLYSSYDILQGYFSLLAHVTFFESICQNGPILTDSRVVNDLVLNYLKAERLTERYNVAKPITAYLTHRVLQEYLPNIKNVPVEAILEIRQRMKTELEAFRFAMAKLSEDVTCNPWNPEIENEIEKVIETKVKPSVYDLRMALTHSKLQILQRVFDNLKDPSTYVPFVGTVLAGIDPSIAMLASIGIASFRILYDTYIENRTIKDANGLVYLLQIPQKLRGFN